jgi:prepilin-type processing-associated H-X9-DG protein
MYVQDYDEVFPPGEGRVRLGNRTYAANWALDQTVDGVTVPGLFFPYVKSPRAFRCPTLRGQKPPARLTYRYNDLAAGASLKAFAGPANTVLVSEGEDLWNNVGHAWTPDAAPVEAVFNRAGTCDAGRGATVQNAPTRHYGKANYVFADGHVKQLPPAAVFFPDQNSDRDAHRAADGRAVGPNPAAGKMTFDGKTYQATFHIQ